MLKTEDMPSHSHATVNFGLRANLVWVNSCLQWLNQVYRWCYHHLIMPVTIACHIKVGPMPNLDA